MKAIVTVTMNPAVDVSAEADAVVPTQKIRCKALRRDPGGGGINVARVLRTMGGPCLAVYAAGGAPGDALTKLLDGEGVGQARISIEGDTRESFSVYEQTTGREFRFVLPGPTLLDAEWQACLASIETLDCDFVVASGSLPPGVPGDFYARLARIVNRQGRRLILDTSGPALTEALGEGVYAIKPNLRELGDWAKAEVSDPVEQLALSRQVIAGGGAEIVALTLGAGGVLLTWKDGCERLAPPKVVLRSAVGAGDSFLAGFVLGLAWQWRLPQVLRLATAAGSAALLTSGTQLCRPAEVRRLYYELCLAPRRRSEIVEPGSGDRDKAPPDLVSAFERPMDVVARRNLSRSQKIEILHGWAYEAVELGAGEDVCLPDGGEDLLTHILDALVVLDAPGAVEHATSSTGGGGEKLFPG